MEKKRGMSLNMIKIIHTVIVVIPFLICWFLYYEPITATATSRKVSTLVIAVYIFILYTWCLKLDGFRASLMNVSELVYAQIISIAMADICIALVIWMLSIHFPYLMPGFFCFLCQCAIIPVLCAYEHKSYFTHNLSRKTLVVYDVRQGIEQLISAYNMEQRFDVRSILPVEEAQADLSVLDEMEVVFLCGIHSRERNRILKECIMRNLQVYIIPRIGDVLMSGAEQIHMFHLPLLRSKRYQPLSEYRFIKRIFDILVSCIVFVLFSPIMLVTAIAVRSDGGPVLYKQTRLTQNGKKFQILKFRSMCVDAEKKSGAVLSGGKNDPRVTKVGRIIRACRVDELPQLLNIIKGEMSIVGPRPERPEIAAVYEKELPEFRLRLQAKAGLTGYAQVYGKYNNTPYDKLLMDLTYISNASVFMDLKIVIQTLFILFDKRSTEGIDEETVALKYVKRENADRYKD